MRYALNETEWSIIQPILPSKPRGVPREAPPKEGTSLLTGDETRVGDFLPD